MTPQLEMRSVNVGPYSDHETEAALMNYFDRGQVPMRVNRALVQLMRMSIDGNADIVRRYVQGGFLFNDA